MEHLLQHPAAIAAGALIIVGPNQRQYIDLQAQSVVISKAGPDEWEPSAISDPQHTEERVP
jgi:hypothetical protein